MYQRPFLIKFNMNKKYYLWLFVVLFYWNNSIIAQELHHQMISSQGTTTTTSTGLIVKQTIGQQSVSGTFQGEISVQQGFQQSYWRNYLTKSATVSTRITTYPNPFEQEINFQFSKPTNALVEVSLFDVLGRLVVSKSVHTANNKITLALPNLPNAEYLVRLSGEKIYYFTKIIKKI